MFSGSNNNETKDSQPPLVRDLCVGLLPVQYTDLTHHKRKLLVYSFLVPKSPDIPLYSLDGYSTGDKWLHIPGQVFPPPVCPSTKNIVLVPVLL